MSKPKILFYDIETAPNLSYTWGIYDQNAIDVKETWHLLSFAWKYAGDSRVSCLSLRHFKGNAKSKEKALAKALHKLLQTADVTVAHNGDTFDYKKAKARFIYHGLKPTRIVPSVDTRKVARKYFAFNSNSLDSLCRFLRIGKKIKTPGFDLWLDCMANKTKSWKLMESYNKKDVELLEKLYNRLLPWMHTHPNMAALEGKDGCPKCGSKAIERRGTYATNTSIRYKWFCQDCRGWHTSPKKIR